MRQLGEHIMILTHSHRPLLESPELIWLEFYHTYGNVVRPEALAKLLPSDLSNIVGTSILVRLPLVLCCSLELARRNKHLLMGATITEIIDASK